MASSGRDNNGAILATHEIRHRDQKAFTIHGQVGTVGNHFERFTPFGRLPGELRLMVWEFAAEEPRLVHLQARNCGIGRFKRRGCPPGSGLKLKNGHSTYTQVPPLFFVNNESRVFAIKYYSIRFRVVQEYRPRHRESFTYSSTNLVMSRNDILVSWHTDHLWDNYRCDFSIYFGPQARFVRNLMVRPWIVLPERPRYTECMQMINMIGSFMRELGNEDALERIYTFHTKGVPPLRYGHSSQRVTTEGNRSHPQADIPGDLKYFGCSKRLEWWLLEGETNVEANHLAGFEP
ncbi:hypothetical protein F5Y10DRAFT_265356 [Nemania abortiva]|nr:hypothetical protein F5Y10DRAFT_265356 [Nemania abortiva]